MPSHSGYVLLPQACLRAFQLQPYALFTSNFIPATTLTLVAGSCITNYCANLITSAGIGNGSSLVICTGIVTGKELHSRLLISSAEAGHNKVHSLRFVTPGTPASVESLPSLLVLTE